MVYNPRQNGGADLAGPLANAIVAAIAKAVPNNMPLALQANNQAIEFKGTGLPAGPYGSLFGKDGADF